MPASARQPDQQRPLHVPQHDDGHHGPHGLLHRAGADLGPVPQLEGRPDAGKVRVGPDADSARRQARADAVRVSEIVPN